MRARQSATSLLGAQARAGVRPEAERERHGGSETWTRKRWGTKSTRHIWDRGSGIPLTFHWLTAQRHRGKRTVSHHSFTLRLLPKAKEGRMQVANVDTCSTQETELTNSLPKGHGRKEKR